MAITWDVKIFPVSLGDRTANIVGVATDDADPYNPITVRVFKAPLETQEEQLAALDILYERYLSKLARNSQIESWLEGKEAAAKANLEARQ